MALEDQDIVVPLGLGLDTHVDPKVAPPGTAEQVENLYQKRTGEWRLRNGVSELSRTDIDGFSAASIRGASSYRDGVISLDWIDSGFPAAFQGAVSAYDSANDRQVRPAEGSRTIQAEISAITATPQGCEDPDCARATNGIELYAWHRPGTTTTGTVQLLRIDGATGAVIDGGGAILNSKFPKCLAAGQWLCLFYVDYATAATSKLKVIVYNTAVPNTSVTYTLVTDMINSGGTDSATTTPYDVIYDTVSKIAVCYTNNSGGANGTTVFYVDPSSGAVTSTVIHAVRSELAIGWLWQDFIDANLYFGCSSAVGFVNVKKVLKSNLTSVSTTLIDGATATARNITGLWDGTTSHVYYEVPNATSYNTQVMRSVNLAPGVQWCLSVGLASKVFKIDNAFYFFCSYQSALQSQYVLMDAYMARACGGVYYGRGPGATDRPSSLSGAAMVSSTQVKIAMTPAIRVSANAVLQSVTAVTLTVKAPNTVEAAGNLFLGGASLRMFDGIRENIAPFMQAPEPPSLAGVNGGGLTALGIYSYSIVWGYLDANGRLWRSAPSVPVTITLTGTQGTVTVTIPALRLQAQTTFLQSVFIEVYRTANGGAEYRLISSTVSPQINSSAANTDVYTDAAADTVQASGELLYTTGNVLPNLPPPPCTAIWLHQNRIWIVNAEDPREAWPSKEIRQGVGVGFHSTNAIRLDDSLDGITAGASMDLASVLFKARSVYVITGDGPNDLGQGVFSRARKISSDVGCTEPRSLTLTPLGLLFRSAKGFQLLTNALQLEYIGSPVEAYNSLTITGAVLVRDQDQVRFTTTAGRTLIYDFLQKKWYTFTNMPAVGACNFGTVFCFAAADGHLYKEVIGQFFDGESNGVSSGGTPIAIPYLLGLAPVSVAGVMGFSRIDEMELLGEYVGDHTLTASVTFDFAGAPSQTLTKAITAASGLPLLRIKQKRQKCTAMKLTLTGTFPLGATGGARLSALILRAGAKLGPAQANLSVMT